MPEYTTADFIEESKREEEQADGYRVVKKGPKFEDMDDFEQSLYVLPTSKKSYKGKESYE